MGAGGFLNWTAYMYPMGAGRPGTPIRGTGHGGNRARPSAPLSDRRRPLPCLHPRSTARRTRRGRCHKPWARRAQDSPPRLLLGRSSTAPRPPSRPRRPAPALRLQPASQKKPHTVLCIHAPQLQASRPGQRSGNLPVEYRLGVLGAQVGQFPLFPVLGVQVDIPAGFVRGDLYPTEAGLAVGAQSAPARGIRVIYGREGSAARRTDR